jgi:hypothetical protein
MIAAFGLTLQPRDRYDGSMLRSIRMVPLVCATLVAFAAMVSLPPSADARPPRRKKKRKAKTGKVQVLSLVNDARVEINGKFYGTTPIRKPIELPPGKYTVSIHKRGYKDFNETIKVVRGVTIDVDASLIAFAGIVVVQTNAKNAVIAVDGTNAGRLPFDREIPAGKHELSVQAKGYKTVVRMINVEAGKTITLTILLKRTIIVEPTVETDSVFSKWWFWTIVGVVVAGGVTTGVILGTQKDPEVFPADWTVPLR